MSKGSTIRSRLVSLGKVVGAHGIRGALKIGEAPAEPETFLYLGEVEIGGARYRVKEAISRKRQVLLRLEGVDTRNQAELLIGQEVKGESSRFPPLPEGEYYWFQLQGLEVRHAESGARLGELADIIPTPGHDVYVVRQGRREILLPAVEEVINEINLEEGLIKVLPPEGWLETYAD
ncbi:MAG: 16S rRNA processing protein RimM [Deltaproteobacteria bacterium]|nr:16S rRNA processing protein RimM [Deltaproteobacteria bacterium]